MRSGRRQNDSRVTPIGRFLRKRALDELPQLWNVLRRRHEPGRPAARAAASSSASSPSRFPFYGQRHVIRPGLTGWAQVRYTYGASVEDAMEKLQYDLFYIKNLSIALDLFIIFSNDQNRDAATGRLAMARARPRRSGRQRA